MSVTPSADEAADVVPCALSVLSVLKVTKATQTTKTEAADEGCNKGCYESCDEGQIDRDKIYKKYLYFFRCLLSIF